jgi:hypothetical protein
MPAGWFCEMSRLNWESGGFETGGFKKKTDFNRHHFEGDDLYPDEL